METVEIDANLVRSLYNYLYSKPYAEVVQLISALDSNISARTDSPTKDYKEGEDSEENMEGSTK